MKLMSPDQCLELLPATRAEAETAASLFPSILAATCRPDYYRTAFAEGWVNPTTVSRDGKQLGLVGWSRSCDGGLWIDCVIAFTPKLEPGVIWQVLDLLEAQERPTYTRFLTCRRAMAAVAESHGFRPVAVLCQREVATR